MVLAAAGLSVAQDQTNTSSSAQTQSSEAAPATEDLRAPAPALLGGDSSSLSFSTELERSNYLRGGLSVGATYDDNAENRATDRVGDFSYSILPNIELDQTRSRLHWVLGYFGGFTANQRLADRNQASHNLNSSLQYRLSPHVDLRLSDNFLDTTGLLQQFKNGLDTPITGPINEPNPTVITPLAKIINNTASADMSYQFSADDVIGGGGTFYDSHFRDQPVGSALPDISTRSADAYYNHRFTPRSWTGITYKFQRLALGSGLETTLTHSLLFSHTIYLQQHMTLSFFAGPEYSEIDTVTVTANVAPPVISFDTVTNTGHELSASGGATFGWQGELTSLHLDATRKITDGGGVLGAVELNSIDGGIRRQFTRTTAVHLNALYGHNRELGTSTVGNGALNSATGGLGIEQQLASNLMLRLDYGRDYQQGGTISPAGSGNHNRGSISISYNFTRPLGR
jgi:hypothetical protein